MSIAHVSHTLFDFVKPFLFGVYDRKHPEDKRKYLKTPKYLPKVRRPGCADLPTCIDY